MRSTHRWLAQAQLITMIVAALVIVVVCKLVFRGGESWLIAFVAGYGAWLSATWIRYSYDVRYQKGPSEADIAAEVQLRLARARASIDQGQ